jgi:WD40 repeat protein/uncharacterized protein YjbI with pentapeptide repeats
MAITRLPRRAVNALLGRVEPQLGKADGDRTRALLALLDSDDRLSVGAALDLLYAGVAPQTALAAFRQFRQRLTAAALEAGTRLRLEVDSQKRTPAEHRRAWFTGEDLADVAMTEYVRDEAATTSRAPVPQDALVVEIQDGKPVVRYFVSYASRNRKLKNALYEALALRLRQSKEYTFLPWTDGDILPGDDWHASIQGAIDACHFGLLLVSYEFLDSPYIASHELLHFVAPDRPVAWKRAVPIGLKPVALDGSVDLKGLHDRQIFRDEEGRFFSERASATTQEAFVERLFQTILAVVRRQFSGPPDDGPTGVPASTATDRRIELAQRRHLRDVAEGGEFVPTEGVSTPLEKLDEEARTIGSPGDRQDALEFLKRWARDPAAPAFCAVLGDYGIGKTTTCKQLAQALLDIREQDRATPLPIYLDLRHLGDVAKAHPTLNTILEVVIARSWKSGTSQPDATPADIVRLVEHDGALVIFDGLDEVLVHLTPAAGQQFTRELWRILPAARASRRLPGADAARARGRMLISCRTHYFRTLRDQKTHLTGEDREGPRASDYRALLLLPFTEAQIRDYFTRNLPGEDVDRILDLLGSVHNLRELAERPYTLSLLARHLHTLERWRAEGRTVTGVTLYRHMVQSWLERDEGKHQIQKEHKQRLMEHLAAALWRSGKRAWNVDDLDQWLIDFFEDNPRLAAHYVGLDRSLLKEDLRTATFLVRVGEADFRFAHSSLQEFFLASFLHRAVKEGQAERWDLPVASPETLDFLGQFVADRDTAACLATLRRMGDTYINGRSELALAYGLRASARSFPSHSLVGLRLDAADLRGWTFRGPAEGEPLSMNDCSFCGANLEDAKFERVALDGADFSRASADRALFQSAQVVGVAFTRARLVGTIFRHCRVDADFEGAQFHRTQWLLCEFDGHRPSAPGNIFTADAHESIVSASRVRPGLQALHGGVRYATTYAAPGGGKHLLSIDANGLRVWDTTSGELLYCVAGEPAGFHAAAIAPDGRHVVVGTGGGTVYLWDTGCEEPRLEVGRHRGRVNSCAMAPDGGRCASAGVDGMLHIYETGSGTLLHAVHNESDVLTCAFSPDGQYVAALGSDGNSRLWACDSGLPLEAAVRAGEGVTFACYSEDGRRLITSKDDGSTRVWDTRSGNSVAALLAVDFRSCAVSPNGDRFVLATSSFRLELWAVKSGRASVTLHIDASSVRECAFIDDGRKIATTEGLQGRVRIWDATQGQVLLTLGETPDRVGGLAFDEHRLAVATAGDVRVWSLKEGQLEYVGEGNFSHPGAFALTSAGRQLVGLGSDGFIRSWQAWSGKLLTAFRVSQYTVGAAAISVDGRILASSDYYDSTVRLWDVATGVSPGQLNCQHGRILSCAFSSDGHRLACLLSNGTTQIWSVESAELIQVVADADATSCAFRPDGRAIVIAGRDGIVRTWDIASRETRQTLHGPPSRLSSCAVAPDGRIAVGGEDGVVRLWRGEGTNELSTLVGHRDSVAICRFSSTGDYLASAAADSEVRIWRVDGLSASFERAIRHLPGGELAVFDAEMALTAASPGAWRWLGYRGPDPLTGEMTRLPAELYGPLPELQAPTPPRA